jgi:hypothetical protein
VISNREDARHELQRLQRALDALTANIEAIERRPRLFFRQDEIRKIENAIGHFAFAVKSRNART